MKNYNLIMDSSPFEEYDVYFRQSLEALEYRTAHPYNQCNLGQATWSYDNQPKSSILEYEVGL